MKKVFWSLSFLSLIFASCTEGVRYVVMQDALMQELNTAKIDIVNLDFYLSNTVVLINGQLENNLSVHKGELMRMSNQTGKKVIIQSSTPGRVVFRPTATEIGVSFDKKDPTKFLMFGLDKELGVYRLLAKKWNTNDADITYGDMIFKTSINNKNIKLMVKERKSSSINYQKEIASGRR